MSEKRYLVEYMARVEGEASLDVRVIDGEIKHLELNVFEPARFFQGFLVGRKYDEVPGIVSRICGICPVSHQMTAVQALEDALGVTPGPGTVKLRKLFALSQWIQSHVLHVYMLALPDFLGYQGVLEMAPAYKTEVDRALRMKRLGNDLTAAIGGREVHPVTATVGGFTSLPSREELQDIRRRLEEAREDAAETLKLVAGLPLPGFGRASEHVALSEPFEYAVNSGRLVSTGGLDIPPWEYRGHIREKQVPHSNALHSYIIGRGPFLVGPLARVNLNFERLHPAAKEAARRAGAHFPSFNPFYSIVARAVEIVHAIEECIQIIDGLEPEEERPDFQVRAGRGFAITEAPRGILYHSYRLDHEGIVEEADIVTPTAHNVYNMEEDMRVLVPSILDLPHEDATLRCEMLIRNYDPCFSCSAHFLKLNVRREP